MLTVEEASLMGGFGSAVLEVANEAGLSTTHVRRLGLPDRYVLHAERDEQLAEVGLDVDGIMRAVLALAIGVGWSIQELKTTGNTKTTLAVGPYSSPLREPDMQASNGQFWVW